MSADDTLRKAVDEAIEPLIADHFAYLANSTVDPMPVSRAHLHYIYDQYGTEMLDFTADLMPVGHQHPFVQSALKEHLGYYLRTAPAGEHVLRWPVEYARDLVTTFFDPDDLPDDMGMQVLFTEGEREAVLAALHIARQISGRDRIAIVDTEVHDWVSLYNRDTIALLPVEEFFIDQFRWENCGALLLSLITLDGRVLEPKWVQEVANRALANGVPVIIDESQTGFGRFGTMWGQQNHQVDASITVLGGPLGGGLSLGAVVAPRAQFDRVSWDLSPQAGAPLACAAGAATLKAINPGVLEHVKEASTTLDEHLTRLVEQFPEFLVSTHGIGLHRVVDFRQSRDAMEFFEQAPDHGLLVAPPVESSLVLAPTLIASSTELVRGVDLMSEVFLDWGE